MIWLKKLWNGEYPLWKTYWLFNVLASFVFYLALVLAIGALEGNIQLLLIVVGGLSLLWMAYIFVALGGLWRSAQAYTGCWVWKYLSYFIVIVGGLKIAETIQMVMLPFL